MLHVTNGDSAAARLREAKPDGEVLPWRDVLHEGPVRAGLGPAALRAERARFIAARGWAKESDVLAELEARDARLERALAAGEPNVLWFESDLHDVLQLAQIAGRLRPSDDVRAVLVGTETFRGVAQLAATEIRAARPEPFDPAPYSALWDAFTAPDPRGLARVDGPPMLRDAAQRLLQQLPWTTDGLNRSERALRDALASGARTREEAFVIAQRQEERPFLGDAVAFDYLEHPVRERWLGGVHLPSGDSSWRYDPVTRTVAV